MRIACVLFVALSATACDGASGELGGSVDAAGPRPIAAPPFSSPETGMVALATGSPVSAAAAGTPTPEPATAASPETHAPTPSAAPATAGPRPATGASGGTAKPVTVVPAPTAAPSTSAPALTPAPGTSAPARTAIPETAAPTAAPATSVVLGPPPGPKVPITKKIERKWDATCSSCHGKDGKGNTEKGIEMGVADITDPAWQKKFTDDKIRATILGGLKRVKDGKEQEMKAFRGSLTPEEIEGLVAFVRSLIRK